MPFSAPKAITALMEEQAAEADQPQNTAMLPDDEPEPESEQPAEQPEEPEQSADEMPLPAEAATDAPDSDDEPDELPAERDEPEAEERDVEPEETPEEVPLPEEAPVESPELTDEEVDASVGDEPELSVPEGDAHEQKPDPEWDDATMQFEAPEIEEPEDDPYGRAMADTEWRMALQGREQILT